MTQSPRLYRGWEVPQDARAVAYAPQDSGAAVGSRGAVGTRQGASDPRMRPLPSQATPRGLVSAAGPCGSWLSRSLPPTG
jgi:hypothetical protein